MGVSFSPNFYLINHLRRGGLFYFRAGVAEWVARERIPIRNKAARIG